MRFTQSRLSTQPFLYTLIFISVAAIGGDLVQVFFNAKFGGSAEDSITVSWKQMLAEHYAVYITIYFTI